MPVDGGFGKTFLQGIYQAPEAVFLRLCPGVFGTVLCVRSANVADSDGVGIVALAVRPRLFEGPALPDGAVKEDDIMIATAVPLVLPVPAVNVCHGIVLAFLGGTAMDDYFSNFAHRFVTMMIKQTVPVHDKILHHQGMYSTFRVSTTVTG